MRQREHSHTRSTLGSDLLLIALHPPPQLLSPLHSFFPPRIALLCFFLLLSLLLFVSFSISRLRSAS